MMLSRHIATKIKERREAHGMRREMRKQGAEIERVLVDIHCAPTLCCACMAMF